MPILPDSNSAIFSFNKEIFWTDMTADMQQVFKTKKLTLEQFLILQELQKLAFTFPNKSVGLIGSNKKNW